MRPKIKICRIIDLNTAVKLVEQGIDYLGFHIISVSDLNLLDEYSTINNYLIENLNFKNSVIVTKISNPEVISDVLLKSKFNYFQFHYVLAPQIQDVLKNDTNQKNFISIYDPKLTDDDYLELIQEFSKYVIIDNIQGGTGQRVYPSEHIFKTNKNLFIAGGINLNNISHLNEEFHPFGFDIQSSAEIGKGVKNFDYIKKIQEAIK